MLATKKNLNPRSTTLKSNLFENSSVCLKIFLYIFLIKFINILRELYILANPVCQEGKPQAAVDHTVHTGTFTGQSQIIP